jgi:signal transduction histidine kinase/putative methionine-R-sulfoxide reductase with GAF domain
MQPNILIVTGNYDIIAAVQRALRSERLTLRAAYTHIDMLNTLAQPGRFDALIIDASMIDRHTGENTITKMMQNRSPHTIIAVALRDDARLLAKSFDLPLLTDLDQKSIYSLTLKVLGRQNSTQRETEMLPKEVPVEEVETHHPRQAQEMETLAAISKSLTEVLDLQQVFNRVVEAAQRLTLAEESMLLLPDLTNPRILVLRAAVGMELDPEEVFTVRLDDSLPGEVFRQGKPSFGIDRDTSRLKTDFLAQSVLYVPIMLHGRTIGVLGVNNRTKADQFEQHQKELLENLATYASIAMHNAQVHEESVQRALELEALVKASQLISETVIMDETLANICEQLSVVLKTSRAEIYQWNKEEATLDLRGHFYQALWRGLKGPVLELEENSDIKKAIDTNHVAWVEGHEFTTLVIPVMTDGRMLGVLRCHYIQKFTGTLDRELHEAARVALEVMGAVLNQSQESSEDDVYLLLNYVNQLVDSDWSEISLLSATNTNLIVLAMAGRGVWREPPYQQVSLQQRPELVEVVELKKILEPENGRGIFALPLEHRTSVWGLVLLSDTDRNRVFAPGEINMANALVKQAAISLENAQLFQQLERSVQELRGAQEKLVQTARLTAMGELAAVVAHQINNPLTTITVDTAMMLEYEPPDSDNYESLQAIFRAGKRAAGVARRLLAIGRPNDPKAQPEDIDVVDTVEGILQLIGSHVERRNIKIHTRFPEQKIPPVLAVKGQLDDIWLNLIMNAHDALLNHPDAQIGVEVAYRSLDQNVVIRIWDNGPGIPDELKERIFAPFFTTKVAGEGTGLGLHICREIVENVGGKIMVESAMGEGTRFTIELPTLENERIKEKLGELDYDADPRS